MATITNFSLGGLDYLISDEVVARLHFRSTSLRDNVAGDGLPVTVFFDHDELLRSDSLLIKIKHMLEIDDVFNESFLNCIIFCKYRSELGITNQQNALISDDDELHSRATYRDLSPWTTTIVEATSRTELQPGPYYLSGSALHKVHRLYEDPNVAFMFGVTTYNEKESSPLYKQQVGGLIPVPSRLYSEAANSSRPLSGKRVAVKDLIDLRGTPTSASSKDYQMFTGTARSTANMVLRLIEAGAVIVGKTKTTQFASGEHARDWIDYQCPFNPRGDGYLEPEGSSTGSAAALAAYSWLDYSIGTDSLGSMLCPAASQGVFALRPTHGLSNLDGIVPYSPILDTVGFFARSVADFRNFGLVWYTKGQEPPCQLPPRLYYTIEDFKDFPEDARLVMYSFLDDLEHMIGIVREPLNLTTLWAKDKDQYIPMDEYFRTTTAHIQLFDWHRNLFKPFKDAFKAANGRDPYVNPMIRCKSDIASQIVDKDYEIALREKEVYSKLLQELFQGRDAVIVLPAGDPKPRRRDDYNPPPAQSIFDLEGFEYLRDSYSILGGLPQIVIPVGSVSRQSPVTLAMVEEPVCVSLVGAKGTDCKLMKLAEQALQRSGKLHVKTGSKLY